MAGTGQAHLRVGDGSGDVDTVLSVEDLVVEFKVGRHETVKAVSGISFDVLRGETLGIVGESGCGKSTTGRAIMQIDRPTSGAVVFEGEDLTQLTGENLRQARTKVQMIWSTTSSSPSASTPNAPRRAAPTSSPVDSASASPSPVRSCSTRR
jgi:peptide/nickel transport system ATP-binding protein